MKKANNRVDMIGKVYNSWKVLEHSHTKGKIAYYKCECLECNNDFVVDGRNVRSGLSKRCLECGHKHGHELQKGTVRTKRTANESAHHYMFIRLKKDAIYRGKSWSLTEEQVKTLITSNCNYCGSEPFNVCHPLKHQGLSQARTEEAALVRNGIDRLDSSKGYEEGNVVSCCAVCNNAKSTMSTEDFKNWIKKVYKHLTKEK